MSLDQTVSELRNEIADLRNGLFTGATVLLAVLMCWNLFAAWNIPHFARIFEDMLGSRDKLPVLTRLVMDYQRAAGGLMAFAMIISFTIIAWSLMCRWKRQSGFIHVAIIAVLLLLAHGIVISLSMSLPMQSIISGISGRF